MAARKKAAKKKKKATKPAARSTRSVPSAMSPGAKAVAESLKKKYPSKILTLDDLGETSQVREFIPTGLGVLDNYVLGRGGLPVTRILECIGDEGTGKTGLLYRALGVFQRAGGVAALADAEYSFDEERASVHGIDTASLIMEQPSTLEECLDMLKDTVSAHNPKYGPLLVGLDSVASLNSKKGVSMAAGEIPMGEVARIWSDELRDFPPLLNKHRAHLFLVNQVRSKIGVVFGSNVTTPGGKAIPFYSSVRLQIFGGKAIKNAEGEHTGKIVTVMAIKNRFASPFRKARIRFDYATGYNDVWSTIEHAKRMKLISPRAKGFSGKGKAGPSAYGEALDALGWDVNYLAPSGVAEDDDDGTFEDDED